MSQTSITAAALILAFFIFVTVRGELPAYFGAFGLGSSPLTPGSGSSGGAGAGGGSGTGITVTGGRPIVAVGGELGGDSQYGVNVGWTGVGSRQPLRPL